MGTFKLFMNKTAIYFVDIILRVSSMNQFLLQKTQHKK